MELAAIQSVWSAPLTSIALIGSGPLPLTSLCLYDVISQNQKSLSSLFSAFWCRDSTSVVNIDHDFAAIRASSELCQKLGSRGRGMKFRCEEAESLKGDLKEFDVVYLAALVGSSQMEKEQLLVNVTRRMRQGSLLVIRTAHSLRTLLYSVR